MTGAKPTTIASASLPPRVRRILQNLYDHITVDFVAALNGMLVEFEQQLFKQAENARNNNRQAEHFVDLRALQKNRGELIPHYMFGLEAELAGIRLPQAKPAENAHALVDYQTLTLVEDAAMDQEIVLSDVARRHESRAATQILLMGQRFGVLAGSPAFDAENLPLGPQRLAHILKDAAVTLDLSLGAQLLLYRSFDLKVMFNYVEWAGTVNQFLASQGVLPGLTVYLPRIVRAADVGGPQRAGASGPAANRPMTGWQGQSSPDSWATLGSQPAAAGTGSAPAASVEPTLAPAVPATPTAADIDASFAALQQLLSIRRTALAADAAAPSSAAAGQVNPPSAAPAASAEQFQRPPRTADAVAAFRKKLLPTSDVLTTLQSLQTEPMLPHAPDQQRRTVQDLQQAMLAQAREKHGPNAALASADSDTFELLGLLYNEIEREVQQDAPAADLLVRLQAPVVQAALRDRDFFLRPQHPARELLNAVAESGATWLGNDDVDPQLVHKLHQAVERVVAEYQGDEAVFERANQDVQQHFQVLARKAELAERRQVEAARGKDRLEVAKQKAAETIQTALRDQQPQKFVQALLSQAWADVLTLTLLRNGENSNDWHEQLQTTLRIVAATTAGEDVPADPELTERIEKSLVQVGYHEDEASAIARRLSSTAEDESTSRTELTARLKARARLGEQTPAKKKTPHPRTEQEQECYDYLRTLPFGTWFEFTRNQQGDVHRQRLSWFSPVTGNALFVNQRGQRVGEQSLDTIAHLMAQGQALVVTEDKGRLIDRAWNATLKALRSLTGTQRPSDVSGADA
ncbi:MULTISPECIES: DUF1631 domain-containing protein [unclassified Pseudoxanthomonas]|uniref:DUF1631 domain-containing protein n=1 Tax=unclassified Pseudoxanthomonas TaxID=2645906 RepID=UPI0030777F12